MELDRKTASHWAAERVSANGTQTEKTSHYRSRAEIANTRMNVDESLHRRYKNAPPHPRSKIRLIFAS